MAASSHGYGRRPSAVSHCGISPDPVTVPYSNCLRVQTDIIATTPLNEEVIGEHFHAGLKCVCRNRFLLSHGHLSTTRQRHRWKMHIMTSRKRRQRSDSDIHTLRDSKRRARPQSGLGQADVALVDDTLPPDENSEEQYWEIKDIIEEKGHQYLIDWKGIDPKTGKSYEPTWVSR